MIYSLCVAERDVRNKKQKTMSGVKLKSEEKKVIRPQIGSSHL